jgi:hypothetical protein
MPTINVGKNKDSYRRIGNLFVAAGVKMVCKHANKIAVREETLTKDNEVVSTPVTKIETETHLREGTSSQPGYVRIRKLYKCRCASCGKVSWQTELPKE